MSSVVRWRRREGVLSRQSLCRVLLLADGSDDPIALTGRASELWNLLPTLSSLRELATMSTGATDGNADEVAALLAELEAAGVIRRVGS